MQWVKFMSRLSNMQEISVRDCVIDLKAWLFSSVAGEAFLLREYMSRSILENAGRKKTLHWRQFRARSALATESTYQPYRMAKTTISSRFLTNLERLNVPRARYRCRKMILLQIEHMFGQDLGNESSKKRSPMWTRTRHFLGKRIFERNHERNNIISYLHISSFFI